MRPFRSDSRGVSPCVDLHVNAYTDDDATTGLYHDQFMDDLFQWVWNVIYKVCVKSLINGRTEVV